MRTVSTQTTGLIATLFLAAAMGLVLLLHVTTRHQESCGSVAADQTSLIKYI